MKQINNGRFFTIQKYIGLIQGHIVSLEIRVQKHVYGVLSLHRARFPWFGLARPPEKHKNSADEMVQSVQLHVYCVHLVHISSRGLEIIGNGMCLFLELPPFYKTLVPQIKQFAVRCISQ